jgi:hypothetical protein
MLTCLSLSMDAKPPEWLACPPLLAISWTSSLERLAKFPGLVLDDIFGELVSRKKVVIFFVWIWQALGIMSFGLDI